MQYQTTRQSDKTYNFSEMIREGVPLEGGLFVLSEALSLSPDFLDSLGDLSFQDRAAALLGVFAPELSEDKINSICDKAFDVLRYQNELVYEAKPLNPYLLNPLFIFTEKGPSACYTDFTHAFSIACLEELMQPEEQWFVIAGESIQSIKSLVTLYNCESSWKPILIADQKSVNNYVLKEIQNLRSTTNIVSDHQSEVSGEYSENESELKILNNAESDQPNQTVSEDDFDLEELLKIYTINGKVQDVEYFTQSLFYDQDLRQELQKQNKYIATVGVLNFSQSIALFILLTSAYLDLLQQEVLEKKDNFALAFPNFNLDFIYVAQLLKKSGLPISHLFAASNSNRAIADFFRRGKYKLKRRFFRTNTPALDKIYFPNIERVLFEATDQDCSLIDQLMSDFMEKESLQIPSSIVSKLNGFLQTGYANNKQTVLQIKEWYIRTDYLLDPYTALTLDVLERFEQVALKMDKIIIPVIENPLISAQASAEAIFDTNKSRKRSYSQLLIDLSEESGISIPAAAYSSKNKPEVINFNIKQMSEQIATDLLSY